MSNIIEAIERLKELSEKKIDNEEIIYDKLIKQLQNVLGIVFSEDYKIFLKRTKNIYFGTIRPFSIDTLHELRIVTKEARTIGVPHDWLPICEDNGDYYCLLPDGTVRFWDHNGSNDEKWDSLADWVEKVWIEEELED